MIKKSKKIVASLLIAASVFSLNPIGASATIASNKIYTPIYTKQVYADSYQWEYRNGNWICATPDFHQSYANAWICTNGKWYYVNNNGYMVTNTWVDNYYVDDTGAWIQTSSNNTIITKAEAIQILMNADNYINKPSEQDITVESIYNKQYYRIPVTFTYPLSNDDGTTRYRTTSDWTRYIDIHTGVIYIYISGELKKEN